MKAPETLDIQTEHDVVRVRQTVRVWARELGFRLVEQTKVITAASELVRNTLEHGQGGTVRIEQVMNGTRAGLRLVFEDRGPGIANTEEALKDGFSTSNGLGLGLGGTRRLVDDFELESELGKGTRIAIVRWA